MDDVALARAEHANLIEAFATVARRRPAGISQREGGVVATVSGVSLPLFNQVVIESDDASAEALAEAVALVSSAGVPFLAVLRDGPDDRFVPVVERLGLREVGEERLPGMALHPIEEPPPSPPELEVRVALDRAGVETHALINAIAADVDPGVLAFLAELGLERDADATVVVGWLDGRPVTTAMGFRTGSVVGVYSVATVPQARRRGLGAAMTREILRAGLRTGCDTAVLQSSEMGLGLYESLGFRTVVRYRSFGPAGAEPE